VRRTPNITLYENHTLVDLITTEQAGTARFMGRRPTSCLGLYALDEATDQVHTFEARRTPSWPPAAPARCTSTPPTPTPPPATALPQPGVPGAGCSNMEFIQFHPTCLYHPHAKSFLISEAVRGEGGRLLLPDGTRFMPQHDERAELAPRDVVARAIDFEMKKGGYDCVYLDISHQPLAFLLEHFPNIYARCLELGIDISKQPIPVVPAAHYTCGGIHTDLAGRTDIAGLHAIGEATYTGLHGANRLASNSLVECMVFARSAATDIVANPLPLPPALPAWDDSRVTDADEAVVISHNWDELRRFMWDYVGIVRTNKRLERAAHRIALLQGRDSGVLRPLPRQPRPAGAAQPGAGGRPDRAQRPGPP
jgi:L-aspartate oxidase